MRCFALMKRKGLLGCGIAAAFYLLLTTAAQAAKIYYADYGADKIRRANLDGSNVEELITTGLGFTFGLRLDLTGGKMYWVDATTGLIERANLDGSGRETVKSGVGGLYDVNLIPSSNKLYVLRDAGSDYHIESAPMQINPSFTNLYTATADFQGGGLDFDLSTGKMYWISTGTGNQALHRANLDGTGYELLLSGLSNPLDVAVDSAGGKVYWNASGVISRANLDGSGVENIVTGILGSQGLTLDLANGKVYWSAASSGKIQRANLDGTNVEDVISGLSTPYKLDILEDANTAAGSSVTIGTAGFSLTLDTVTAPGLTQILDVSDAEANSFLADPMIGGILRNTVKDFTTTATVSGIHLIQIPYNEADIPAGFTESQLRLFHKIGPGQFEDITFSIDTVNNLITGQTTSFSTFGVGVNPEPATLLLLGAGLLGLLPLKRNRK